ncbi:MAG: hypothetical protein NTV09_05910 [Bacteroidetes bacterium]|nr:hypothetical protein [Bacteroidota bacterium]
MKISQIKNLEFYKRALELISIGNRGVSAAILENEKKGLPNVFGIKNRIYYRMPDGTITSKSPFKKKK